jgi:hypothetical protein
MKVLVDDPFDSTAISLMAAAAPDPSTLGVTKMQVRVDLKVVRAPRWQIGGIVRFGNGDREFGHPHTRRNQQADEPFSERRSVEARARRGINGG